MVSPHWDVWVVDEAGRPVYGINVTMERENFSCESVDHSETMFTDKHGHAQFHARYLKWNPLKCAVYTAGELFKHEKGRHASVTAGEPNGIVFGQDIGKNGKLVEWRGSPDHMVSHIILKRQKPPPMMHPQPAAGAHPQPAPAVKPQPAPGVQPQPTPAVKPQPAPAAQPPKPAPVAPSAASAV
jgi:hypothetical protein